MASASGYLQQLRMLLPRGRIWPTDRDSTLERLLMAFADSLGRADARILHLVDESDPRTTVELIGEWERMLRLPEECIHGTHGAGPWSFPLRRLAVVEKLTRKGGQTVAFYLALGTALGYEIEIQEIRPFQCGRSECSDELGGVAANRFYWYVRVLGPRVTYFQCGAAECSDSLGTIDEAEDLECLLERTKPAHTVILFSYEG